jgi:quinol-cytochrome oxidoreductase complex cytochrome b subunit
VKVVVFGFLLLSLHSTLCSLFMAMCLAMMFQYIWVVLVLRGRYFYPDYYILFITNTTTTTTTLQPIRKDYILISHTNHNATKQT